jgi:hypothetical protein
MVISSCGLHPSMFTYLYEHTCLSLFWYYFEIALGKVYETNKGLPMLYRIVTPENVTKTLE